MSLNFLGKKSFHPAILKMCKLFMAEEKKAEEKKA